MLLAVLAAGLTDMLDPRVMVRPASLGALDDDARPDPDDAPAAEACE
jgi:hypothetical protein